MRGKAHNKIIDTFIDLQEKFFPCLTLFFSWSICSLANAIRTSRDRTKLSHNLFHKCPYPLIDGTKNKLTMVLEFQRAINENLSFNYLSHLTRLT